MASSRAYMEFILEQLSGLEAVTVRPMMGEFLLYYKGKLIGGIYDDRLLVKPVAAAVSYMPDASREAPYDGAKELLLVENVEDRDYLAGLFDAMLQELPAPSPGRKRRNREDT